MPEGDRSRQEAREQDKQRRRRSLAIALALAGLVVLFYAATIVRLGPNALNKGSFTPQPGQKGGVVKQEPAKK